MKTRPLKPFYVRKLFWITVAATVIAAFATPALHESVHWIVGTLQGAKCGFTAFTLGFVPSQTTCQGLENDPLTLFTPHAFFLLLAAFWLLLWTRRRETAFQNRWIYLFVIITGVLFTEVLFELFAPLLNQNVCKISDLGKLFGCPLLHF